jgi:hypothetical protein
VEPSPTHLEVESRFRELVGEAGLAEPDDVAYSPGSVTFLWHADRLAVVVDLDPGAVSDASGAGRTAGP